MSEVNRKAVTAAARALHKHACEKVRRNGGTKGIDWVPWKRLPEFAQGEYRDQAVTALIAARPHLLAPEPDPQDEAGWLQFRSESLAYVPVQHQDLFWRQHRRAYLAGRDDARREG